MNWGYRLMFVFIAFGALMGTLVYKSLNTKFDVVSTTYYEDEMKFQSIIDGTANAQLLANPVSIEAFDAGVVVAIPGDQIESFSEGDIWFYCETDASKDFKSGFTPDKEGVQIFPRTMLEAKKYIVKLKWKAGDKDYYSEEIIKWQ